MMKMITRAALHLPSQAVPAPAHLVPGLHSCIRAGSVFTHVPNSSSHWPTTAHSTHTCTNAQASPRRTCARHAMSTQAAPAADESKAVADGVLLCGFPPEDLHVLANNLDLLFPGCPIHRVGVMSPTLAQQPALSLAEAMPLPVTQAAEQHEQWVQQCEAGGNPQAADVPLPEGLAVRYGRVIYLLGGAAAQYGHTINDVLVKLDVAPAVVGGMQPRHADMKMSDVCDALRRAHAQYWELIRPAALAGELGQLLDSYQQKQQKKQQEKTGINQHSYADKHHHRHLPQMVSSDDEDGTAVHQSSVVQVEHGTGGVKEGGRWGEEPKGEAGHEGRQTEGNQQEHVLEALASTRLVVAATMDAGEVPCSVGGWRHDESHVVALDGLITDEERIELLDWLTEPGHDHRGPPPDHKWEQACVDREGDPASWGLRQEMLQQLESSPPPSVVALQTRLAALYPEYVICHMPAEVLSGNDEGMLSTFVGNAVMAGDPCAWHDDADPAALPPSSPWVHCYGYYYNREPGRPRFVSVLLYLNEAWPDEMHAETLFLDNEAQAGLFVRPAPGRVVLMDQDMPHRISLPSPAANGAPRYSLVWKMVWFPRNDPTLGAETPTHALKAVKGNAGEPGLCREEWGPPLRVGSAGEVLGRPVWSP